jgi:hypothetical protein
MSYHVQWTPSAHDRLELLWMNGGAEQAYVLRAANAIDAYLAHDPHRVIASRIGDERTFVVEPLAVDFAIFEHERRVIILSVWMIGFLDRDG